MGLFGAREQNQARFYDDLATSLDSGMPIRQALKTVAGGEGIGEGPFRVAYGLETALSRGETLADALEGEPRTFSAFERHVVAAGEKGGRLVEALQRLAKHFERRGAMRDGIGYGLIYPVGLIHLAFLLPPLKELITGGPFAYARAALLPLGILWLVVLGGGAAARALGASGALDRIVLSVPALGPTVRSAALLELVSSLGALYGAGVPVLEALDASAEAVRNRLFADAARRARTLVREGGTLSEGFEPSRAIVGGLFIDAVRIGEASGRLEETFERLEKTLTDGLERRLKTITALLPVIAYLAVAGYIAWTIVSFYTGYFNQINELTR